MIEKEYAAWRAAFGLPGIEAYLQAHAAPQLSQLQAAVDRRRDQVYTELSRASRNPADDCRNIRTQLTTQINLPVLLPQAYALTKTLRAAGPDTRPVSGRSPGTQPGGTFLTITMFTPLSKEAVLNLLVKVGSQPPYQGGGPLQTGVYSCAQQNTRDFEDLQSAVFYTLTLYGNQGLRLSEAKFASGSTGTSSPLKDLQGAYRYDRTTGQLTAETDYANRNLTDYLFPNGRYDGVGGDPPLYNTFRVLTDGRGRSLMYGQKAYGRNDGRLTVCQHQGLARGTSPVAEARQAAQAELGRFNRYRLKPNASLKLAQIEGLMHTYENSYDGINVIGQETTTLLLKDETAYLNLRWSPHDLDVAASRKGEPKAWTKWRRQGSAYEPLLDDRWAPIKGTLGVPAEKMRC